MVLPTILLHQVAALEVHMAIIQYSMNKTRYSMPSYVTTRPDVVHKSSTLPRELTYARRHQIPAGPKIVSPQRLLKSCPQHQSVWLQTIHRPGANSSSMKLFETKRARRHPPLFCNHSGTQNNGDSVKLRYVDGGHTFHLRIPHSTTNKPPVN